MGAVSRFFAEFDLLQAPAYLRIKEDDKMKSLPIGVASFITSCLFLYIFVISCVNILKYESINAIMYDTVISQQNAQGYLEMVAIGIDNLTIEQIDSMFAVTSYLPTDDPMETIFSQSVPCTPQHWISLGQNYISKFYQYQLDRCYCLNITNPIHLQNTVISYLPLKYVAYIQLCTYHPRSASCYPQKGRQYVINHTPKISFYILDTGFSPQERISNYKFINTDYKITVFHDYTQIVRIQCGSFRIETDQSLISFSQNSVETGIWVNTARIFSVQNDLSYEIFVGRFDITMNTGLRVYSRTIGKLDNLLSYVGGLFQILIGFLSFFISSFNQYRYEIKVSEGAFNFVQNGKIIKESDFTLLRYVQYIIYDWVNTLFCVKLKWQFCNQIDEIRKQVISQMEVNRFFKRILNEQTAIHYALGDHQKNFIKLIEPPTMQQVKQRRLKLYYSRTVFQAKQTILKRQRKNTKTQGKTYKRANIGILSCNSNQKQENIQQITQTIKLSPQLQKIEMDLANSLFAIQPQFRDKIKKSFGGLIFTKLKVKSQKAIKII